MTVSGNNIEDICRLIRYYILESTTKAGSGHPSSSLSAVELMAVLFFKGFFRYRLEDPAYINNDRIIFSKGHASPLLYALWGATGSVSHDDILSLRKFESNLEGHPTRRFKYTDAATGSLGQGLSIGAGMALVAKQDDLNFRTFVLLGDSEMSEGSQWEALQLAAHYGLDNLTGIIDVNRLGQRGETMYGHDLSVYRDMVSSFGWDAVVVEDGHDMVLVEAAYKERVKSDRPTMIIARTVKGKGVSFIEDKDGWHGKALEHEQYIKAMAELGEINTDIRGEVKKPDDKKAIKVQHGNMSDLPNYTKKDTVSTRQSYGDSLARLADVYPELVVLDAEVSNSTYSQNIKETHKDRFFEMYIAEQNMVGMALGMSLRGKIPFVSTFAAFLARAYDQIRMSLYSGSNIKFCGSHAGVSIGQDGGSQMGLEDILMFRSLPECIVLYPSDAVSTEAAVRIAARHEGNAYIRTTRVATPVLYDNIKHFKAGKSYVLKQDDRDQLAVITGGITLHEALKAYEVLAGEGIFIRVIDIFSIDPIDAELIISTSRKCKAIITVEDHYGPGGIGEAVAGVAGLNCPVIRMYVDKIPRSGRPEELLDYEGISGKSVVKKVREII